jgi:predicted transposase YbfD/YdcC
VSLSIDPNALACLESVPDPRMDRRKRHKLVDILVIALCGFLAGCEGWTDVELFGKSKRKWLETFLELPNGIPSHDTFGRVFALLDPQSLVGVLRQFVQTVTGLAATGPAAATEAEGTAEATGPLDGETVAIDGKTARRSGQTTTGQAALHLVSAWAVERGVVLGQVATADHSNEITAIPVLLRVLDLRGAVVTIDAMGCQKKVARQVCEQGGDYVLAVKGNQKNLRKKIRFQMGPGHSQVPRAKLTTREKSHGREDTRTYTVMAAPAAIRRYWPDAQSIVRACRESTQEGKRKSTEVRYFISSLPPTVEELAERIRGHWGIENSLHWSLDVTFNEDRSRIRQGHAAENAALLRRLALSILKQDTGYSGSLRGKRLRAAWETSALAHFLMIFTGN